MICHNNNDMKIINETELMTNQKASTVVVPDKQFEALQTTEGHSILFSIGNDNILYCTREVPGDTHGWVRVNLTPTISQVQKDLPNIPSDATISARTFDIIQDAVNATTVDVALVVTLSYNNQQQDYLYIATGFTNTLDYWANHTPAFVIYPFDDYANPNYAGLPINDVQLLDAKGSQYIIADIISNSETQTISRYYIDPSKSAYTDPDTGIGYAWVPHVLPLDLQAGNITTLLGCGPKDGPSGTNIGGTYVLGSVNGAGQMAYIPTYNYVDVYATPDPTIFGFPTGYDATHMAIALSAPTDNAPYTDLFFASNYTDAQGQAQGGLFFLSNANQFNKGTGDPTPTLIYTSDLLKNIQKIRIENWNDNIVLWGESEYTDATTNATVSRLFIMEGVAGQETNSDAWSFPITLLVNVENSSAYINNKHSLDNKVDAVNGNAYGSCSILFAHQADGSLVQLFQDPITTAWQERSLLIVPNSIEEIYETTTYSSHIEITDDSNIPQANCFAYVWSSSPCSVYVTDANNTAGYFSLEFDKPTKFETDLSGNILLMQPVDAIGGIAFNVAVQDPVSQAWFTQVINPMAVSIANLNKKVPDGDQDHLQNVPVTDETGATTQLVSSDFSNQTASSSNQVYTICQQNSTVNKDGLTSDQETAGGWPDPATAVEALNTAINNPSASALLNSDATGKRIKKFAKADRQFKHLRFDPKSDKIWGWTFGENAKQYEGIEAVKALGIILNADGSLSLQSAHADLGGIFSHIESKIGHVVKWIKSEAHQIAQVIVTAVKDAVDCLITIAGNVYHFVAKCVTDVVNMVHTALNAIKTAFEDVVKWIGMIFSFKDILRTHSVMKTMINLSTDYCISNISSLDGLIRGAFDSLKNEIDTKTGLPTTPLPDDSVTYSSGMQNAKQVGGSKSPSANYGVHHMKNNSSNADLALGNAPDFLDSIFDDLVDLINKEKDAFSDTGKAIKDLAGRAASTAVPQLIAEFMGIVAELLASTAEAFLLEIAKILDQLIVGAKDQLNATMHIPVLTYMYKKITKTDENPDGDDLTPLDLGCLICSFFSTVVFKVVKERPPFPEGALTDAMINAEDMDSLQLAIQNFEAAQSVSQTPGLLGHGENGVSITAMIASIDAMIGAIGIDFCTFIRANLPNDPIPNPANVKINKIFTTINSVCYVAYVYPDLLSAITSVKATGSNKWFVNMNNLCTGIGLVKASADIVGVLKGGDTYNNLVSPIWDFILNVAWQVSTTAEYIDQFNNQKKTIINSTVLMIGGTAFDLSGILSPTLAGCCQMENGAARTTAVNVVAALISGCNLVWGGACLATTFDELPNPQ